ncbi:p-loop containing nucleoside triphosphate hydrolase protein [Ceraceosorus bombacis]|uniref:RNA helicase n=1 Tax=Ceraceosorus bombacis TaxID=401625 RepID=A0A0P1BI37_9BASI|nr:p-loop containing nucleoside triphosphate hydrolase protein [Ceraceosorus bombacis]
MAGGKEEVGTLSEIVLIVGTGTMTITNIGGKGVDVIAPGPGPGPGLAIAIAMGITRAQVQRAGEESGTRKTQLSKNTEVLEEDTNLETCVNSLHPTAAAGSHASPGQSGTASPSGSSSPFPASTAAGKGASTSAAAAPTTALSDDKQRKKERLEAWRKAKEAEKAVEEAKAKAAEVAANFATKTPTTLKLSAGATSINTSGLKASAAVDLGAGKRGAASVMDDMSEQPAKRDLKKLNLPPIDPLLKPGAGGKVGAGSDLEDEGDEEEEEAAEQSGGAAAMQIDSRPPAAEDEEDDPLDAFMAGVKDEVKEVDAADQKRLGISGGKQKRRGLAEVVGDDDGMAAGVGNEDPSANAQATDELGEANAEEIMALAAAKIKKKEMPAVDHAKMQYEPFRKAFYHPPSEIEEMTEDDAERLRMELDAIKVRGKDCPKPLTKWSHCGLPARCLDIIKKLGWKGPTPIQAQAIPAIMSGRDVIGVAKTGSGKTMAFLLPMFRHIKDQRPVESLEGPIGLIMTPTRELAVQIFRESKPFLNAIGLRGVCVYGGAPISEQIAEMKRTAQIVVATPGRMIDLLTANSGRVTNLRRVTYLVLDEADRMFDMGFEPQVMKIVNNVRPDRQTVLFSATFPKQMESLARKVLKNKPVEVTVGGRSVVAPEIEQIIEVRSDESKFNRLLEILGQTYNVDSEARTLIFVERQESADDLLRDLMRKGYVTMSLHGGKDQVDRDATISDFKAGIVPIVTATSVAARGLDVKQLKLVINYDVPNHMEDYVHRAGRTGRAGNKGTCVTFITPQQDRYARDIIAALKASSVAVPEELQQLADAFKDKVAAGKAHAAGSGFGGKGLDRLENDRERLLQAQRSTYGEGEAPSNTNTDQNGQGTNAAAVDDIKVQRGPPISEEEQRINDMHIEVKRGAVDESLKENKVKAPSIDVEKSNAAAAAAAATAAANQPKIAGANATKLAQALAQINAAAEARKQAEAEQRKMERKPKDPDATEFHAVVPINDFPQKARWSVTNKETVSRLIEVTGASVTLRGQYYEKGEPSAGEPPKLQLLIESNDEDRVERAVRAIKELLLESAQAALEHEQRNPAGQQGRYQVL